MRYTLHGSATGKIASKELIGLSYAVVRMVKLKSHDLKGIQFHNQRERESKTNPDIDSSKTENNYDLVNESNIDYNKRVKEIIESQKEGTRKTRKDAVLVNELLVTSDASFFDKLSPADERTFFEESLSFFAERYGKQNIAFSMVHKDEKTPHMHVGVVPMRDGRLQGKNIFNRQELLWLQEEFPKHMQQQGFELQRGEKGSDRQHIEMQKFKKMTLEKQIENLEERLVEIRTLEEKIVQRKLELFAFTEHVPSEENATIRVLGNEVKTEVKPKLFGHDEVIESQTENLIIGPDELVKVNKAFQAAQRVQHEYERLLTTDLIAQNNRLFREIDKLIGANTELVKENTSLKSENGILRAEIGHLVSEIKNVYKATKTFFKTRTNDSKRFKELLKDFMSEVKEHLPNSKFEMLYKKEQSPERHRGMER